MKRIKKKILLVLLIWCCVFFIDFVCIKTIKRPIFMIRTVIYKDGGTKEYYGLGYKVIKCNNLMSNNKITIGTYFLNYNCDTNSIEENITLTDSVKFSKEYTKVTPDNVFVYRNIDEIVSILENGTGVVYLGFPECKWCQAYVPYLNEVAKENNLEKIYYFNILEDRKNNTEGYKKIVNLLKNYLQYDEEGKKRIYVPAVVVVKSGKIVGFNDETSLDTKGYTEPIEYWNDKEVVELKKELTKMIKNVNLNVCTDCNK